jgi:hypothetical protein
MVRVVTGDFANLEAALDLTEGAERATVLLELPGRQSRVRVGVGGNRQRGLTLGRDS